DFSSLWILGPSVVESSAFVEVNFPDTFVTCCRAERSGVPDWKFLSFGIPRARTAGVTGRKTEFNPGKCPAPFPSRCTIILDYGLEHATNDADPVQGRRDKEFIGTPTRGPFPAQLPFFHCDKADRNLFSSQLAVVAEQFQFVAKNDIAGHQNGWTTLFEQRPQHARFEAFMI